MCTRVGSSKYYYLPASSTTSAEKSIQDSVYGGSTKDYEVGKRIGNHGVYDVSSDSWVRVANEAGAFHNRMLYLSGAVSATSAHKDPPKELLDIASKYGVKYRGSKNIKLQFRKHPGTAWMFTGKNSDDLDTEVLFDKRLRAKLSKQYGYWAVHGTKSFYRMYYCDNLRVNPNV